MQLILSFLLLFGAVYSSCPPGSDYISQLDICLAVVDDGAKYGFYQAEVQCNALGGHLSSVSNAFVNTLLYGHAIKENVATGAYIGLNRNNGQWSWIDGSNVTYTSWAAGQPTERDDCAILNMNDAMWYTAPCTQPNATYFCTIHPIQACPTGWTHHNGTCYLFKDTYPSPFSWSDSRAFCRISGGDLVSIHSADENTFLTDFAKPQPCGHTWIGLQWNGNYSWSDGSPVDFNNATRHEQQAPVHFILYPSCISGASVGWWDDYDMTTVCYSFICEKPATANFSALTNGTNNKGKFPQEEAATKVEHEERKNWGERKRNL